MLHPSKVEFFIQDHNNLHLGSILHSLYYIRVSATAYCNKTFVTRQKISTESSNSGKLHTGSPQHSSVLVKKGPTQLSSPQTRPVSNFHSLLVSLKKTHYWKHLKLRDLVRSLSLRHSLHLQPGRDLRTCSKSRGLFRPAPRTDVLLFNRQHFSVFRSVLVILVTSHRCPPVRQHLSVL